MTEPLNGTLSDNGCFGCGLRHETGLRIEIFRDPAKATRLVGSWQPRGEQVGFPEIIHGGLQYTALDCMAGWATWVLCAPPGHMVLTAKGTMKYLRPAAGLRPLSLAAELVRPPASPRDPFGIVATISDEKGNVISEGDFDYVSVPAEKFLKLVGLSTLPGHYQQWLATHGRQPT